MVVGATVALAGGVGYVAYEMENDARFAAKIESAVPDYVALLDPLREYIRSSGMLPAAGKVPPTPAPAGPKPTPAAAKATPAPAVEKQAAATAAAAAAVPPAPAEMTAAEIKARQLRLAAAAEVFDEMSLQSVALRKELEQSLLHDLHKLDADALRTRMTQLAAEFFERTKWESLRMHQAMRQVETDVARKYLELMNQQRGELEAETKKALAAKEEQLNAHHAHITALAGTVDGFD